MELRPTVLAGVVEATPVRHGDDRGWFSEVFNAARWREAGIDITWVQDNESLSGPRARSAASTSSESRLRRTSSFASCAAEFSTSPSTCGVALRPSGSTLPSNSPPTRETSCSFPRASGTDSEPSSRTATLPTRSSAPYDRDTDAGIHFADPSLGIDWGIDVADAVLSDKDRDAPLLADAEHLLFD